MTTVNPNSDREYLNTLDLKNTQNFPHFLKSIKLGPFRHIEKLEIDFSHPISVISGTNRSGKSTVMMALACSHYDFKKRNPKNGLLERQTWSSLMKFTDFDKQDKDWTYWITYKIGDLKQIPKRGQRKHDTKKWNGIGKKESQFKNRQVVFIDLDRISPARTYNDKIYDLAKSSSLSAISNIKNVPEIQQYISYILEEDFRLNKIAEHQDKDVYQYSNNHEYSSYNAASGEDVLTKIIIDIVEASKNSLILIDEIEVGLHPKVQRRLIDVLYHIARNEHKQFVLTTHSPSILSSLPDSSRVFIERTSTGMSKAIPNITVNAALSKMDSVSYPLVDLYCEDDISNKIIMKAIVSLQEELEISDLQNLINVIPSSTSEITFANFEAHKRTYKYKKIKTGYACILDGDMRNSQNRNGTLKYKSDDGFLHFIYSSESPEQFLLRAYLTQNSNSKLKYHLDNSNPHYLFQVMVEESLAIDVDKAFQLCWNKFMQTTAGHSYLESLKLFIMDTVKHFSPHL